MNLLRVSVLVFMSISAAADRCTSVDRRKPCECKTNSGFLVNLKNVKIFDGYKPVVGTRRKNDTSKYKFSACKAFKDCKGSVCQKADKIYNAGNAPHGGEAEPFHGDPLKNSLTVNYVGGIGGRESRVHFVCSHEESRFIPLGETAPSSKVYEFKVYTKEVCKDGLSAGTILCIILCVVVFVYLVGGFLVLRFARGARGVEQIPNYDFWIDLPLLIWEGIMFAKSGCKPPAIYDQI